jgi:hypothetical protein
LVRARYTFRTTLFSAKNTLHLPHNPVFCKEHAVLPHNPVSYKEHAAPSAQPCFLQRTHYTFRTTLFPAKSTLYFPHTTISCKEHAGGASA